MFGDVEGGGRRRWKMKMKNGKHQNIVFQLHAIK